MISEKRLVQIIVVTLAVTLWFIVFVMFQFIVGELVVTYICNPIMAIVLLWYIQWRLTEEQATMKKRKRKRDD